MGNPTSTQLALFIHMGAEMGVSSIRALVMMVY
jgi:hypothetical protein